MECVNARPREGTRVRNLIRNPGFRRGLDGWETNGHPSIRQVEYKGRTAVRFARQGAVQRISQRLAPVPPGRYALSFAGAVDSSMTSSAVLAAIVTYPDGTEIHSTQMELREQWGRSDVARLTVDADVVAVDIAVLPMHSATASPANIYLSEFVLRPLDAPAPEPVRWIENGDFETGELAPWQTDYSSDIVRVVREDGNRVLFLAPAMRGVWQSFPQPTPAGKDVAVRFRARNLRSPSSILSIFLAEGEGFSETVEVVVEPNWREYEVSIPVHEGYETHALYFTSPMGGVGVPVHIDDVEAWVKER
jgi:hypothetical protein